MLFKFPDPPLFDRYDKKLAGYNNVSQNVAQTVSDLLSRGYSDSEIVQGLLREIIPIQQKVDF